MKRRDFLSTCGKGLATAALGAGGAGAAARGAQPRLDAGLERGKFAPYVGGEFWVYEPARGIVTVRLVRIIDCKSPAGHRQFTLLFRSHPDDSLAPGTYTLENAESGRFQVYLQSAGADARGNDYRAEFNLV